VGETLRVVRVSRRTPRRSSSPRMMWLSADCVMPSLAAARVKLRSRATARKTRMSLMFSRPLMTVIILIRYGMTVKAYGAHAADKPLESMDITRRAPGAHDVQIDIAFCGVCHSDLHQVRGEWAGTLYPCVPGHEIVGRVSAVGDHVHNHKVGDLVGVGCMVDSCQALRRLRDGLENYCDGMVGTYNGPTADAPGHTLGGYSEQIVVTSASCCA
jgi:hypothetical protein